MGPRGGCTCLVRNVVGPERLVVVRKRVQRISRHLVVPDALVRVAARHTRCRRVSVHMATAELGLRTLIVLVLGGDHRTGAARHVCALAVDRVLRERVHVAVEVKVEATRLHGRSEILHIDLVGGSVADHDEPIVSWHGCERLLEPVELRAAVLRQDVFVKLARALVDWGARRELGAAYVENKAALSLARSASRRHPQWQIQAQAAPGFGHPRPISSLEPWLVGQAGLAFNIGCCRGPSPTGRTIDTPTCTARCR